MDSQLSSEIFRSAAFSICAHPYSMSALVLIVRFLSQMDIFPMVGLINVFECL